MSSLPEPRSPSPLVKLSRWTMLITGIVYGVMRQRRLAKIECCRRWKEEQERPAREAAEKEEKDRRNREEMEYLSREVGVDLLGGGSSGSSSSSQDCSCGQY